MTVDGFVSDTNSVQVVDVIPANGTSGPYQLSSINGLANSEQVDIITRDRSQPALIISDVPMTRLTDYEIEPYSGQILFKAPIASLDANLNPIFVRVTYEVSNAARTSGSPGRCARKAAAVVHAAAPIFMMATRPIQRACAAPTSCGTWDRPLRWSARSRSPSPSNMAWAMRGVSSSATAIPIYRRALRGAIRHGFNNASSTVLSGGAEYGAKVGYALTKTDRLVVNATKTTTSLSTGQIEDASVGIEHSLPMNMKLTGSVRHVSADDQGSIYSTPSLGSSTGTDSYTSGLMRLDAPVPHVPKANAFLQYEQAVNDSDRRNATVGATYQLGPQTKFLYHA